MQGCEPPGRDQPSRDENCFSLPLRGGEFRHVIIAKFISEGDCAVSTVSV